MPKEATRKTTRKPNPPRTVTTRAANATAHPGLIASMAHKPADPSVKMAKANKAAKAVAKAEAKEHKGAHLAKFQEDAMDREEMLEATPRPDITPACCCTHVPSSGLRAAGSVVESEVDTDDINPDKATYQPGSTTEDDSISKLSAVPTSPIKPTYAQVVASPTPKKKIPQPAATAQVAKAAAATSSRMVPPAKLAKEQAYSAMESNTAMEPDSPAPSRPAEASKTSSNADPLKASKSTHTTVLPVSAPLCISPLSAAVPSIIVNPGTPVVPQKSWQKRISSPTVVSETEADSPPPKPKACSLQRLKSCHDLGEIDKDPLPKRSVAKVGKGKGKGKETSDGLINLTASWKMWRADPRKKADAGEAMKVDVPVEAVGGANWGRPTTKKRVSAKRVAPLDPIDQSLDIEVLENNEDRVEGKGKEKRVDAKGKEKEKIVEEKGKGKARTANDKDTDSDMGTSEVTVSKRAHQDVDGGNPV